MRSNSSRWMVAVSLLMFLTACGGSGRIVIPELAEEDASRGDLASNEPLPTDKRPADDGTQPDATLPAQDDAGDAGNASADAASPVDASPLLDATTLKDGPPVVGFSVAPQNLTQGQSVTFRAIVTDPQGPANLAANELRDDQGATYGAFLPGAMPSSFAITLTWSQLSQVRTIEFAPPSAARKFVATFTNLQGKSTSATVDVTFACANAHSGACAGACVDFWADASCGACGNACDTGVECRQGSCDYARWSACFPRATTNVLTCAEQCQNIGKTCTVGCTGCGPGQACESQSFLTALGCQATITPGTTGTCSSLLPTSNLGAFRCCCM